jgi:hypothetical protein
MFMFDWIALMTPPEGHPGQLAYTFVICILSSLNFNILCLLLLYVSISVVRYITPSPQKRESSEILHVQ